LSTARSFYYRERTKADDSSKPSFNYHYDRMNISATFKDVYYMHGEKCENPEGAGLYFNLKNGDKYHLALNDSDLAFHIGMTGHILTGGIIPAHAHAVYLPNIEGLARCSSAFFFSPSPKTDIYPPIPIDVTKQNEEDKEVMPP
jgi:hypothetical protein